MGRHRPDRLGRPGPAAAFAEIRRVLRPDGEARIYDVRCAGFGPDEVRRSAASAGLAPGEVRRRIFDERLVGLRPYSVITIRPAHGAERDADHRPTDDPRAGATGIG